MVLRSTTCAAGHGSVPVSCAETLRRLPLTRISVYAGPTPRSDAAGVFLWGIGGIGLTLRDLVTLYAGLASGGRAVT